MPTYVNAATVRIQTYLARTPKLSQRRGASWMITRATRAEQVDAWIAARMPAGVRRNREAGHVDGVVALEVPDDYGRQAALGLLDYLRAAIPGAELEAEWASGPTSLEAFGTAGRRTGDTLASLPPLADFPLAYTCASCRIDIRATPDGGCRDCRARDAAAGRRAGDRGEPEALGTEKRLLEAVNQHLGVRLRTVQTLNELAAMGGGDGNRNHVATVAADGNALGAFFAALSRGADTGLKRTISPIISAATFAALVEASTAVVRPGDAHLPVVPHVVGGDDVVVTVTADRAWPLVSGFLAAFDRQMSARTRQAGLDGAMALPTMSAGVVFAQAAFPYARAVHLAESAMRRAKRDLGAAQPAVSWLDVTVDGEQTPPWRRTITAGDLAARHSALGELAGIGKSGRQQLARLLAADSPDTADAAARVWARRNGNTVVPQLLAETDTATVRNLLALASWWRP